MNINNIDWQTILDSLRTEHLIGLFTQCDPLELASNPWVIIPVIIVLVALYLLKFRKVIVIFAGLCGMWLGFYYGMPYGDAPLDLENVLIIGGTIVGVAAFWIYVFFISGD